MLRCRRKLVPPRGNVANGSNAIRIQGGDIVHLSSLIRGLDEGFYLLVACTRLDRYRYGQYHALIRLAFYIQFAA